MTFTPFFHKFLLISLYLLITEYHYAIESLRENDMTKVGEGNASDIAYLYQHFDVKQETRKTPDDTTCVWRIFVTIMIIVILPLRLTAQTQYDIIYRLRNNNGCTQV